MAIEQGRTIEFRDIDNIYGALFSSLPYRGYMGEGNHQSKDFNDYKTNGIYNNGGTNNGFINAPHPADNGFLIVVGVGRHQFWFSEYQLLPTMYRYLTSKVNNTWSDWSSLVLNVDALTYEEIMASTDLSGKVASASVLKTLSYNLSGFSVLKTSHAYGNNFNIDDLSNYPRGTGLLNYTIFSSDTTGTKPFEDGHLLTFVWRNDDFIDAKNYLTQIAIEDDSDNSAVINMRSYSSSAKAWRGWKTVSIL